MLKRILKNQRGMTLVELLVVVVILGIIVAIAVPSVGSIMDNTKKDAHIANAQQLAGAAKMYITAENITPTTTEQSVSLDKLITEGYMDDIQNPSDKTTNYNRDDTKIYFKRVSDTDHTVQYFVEIKGTTKNHLPTGTDKVQAKDLKRSDVTL